MAPPQVDLNGKQPLEDIQGWANKVGDQKLPPLPADLVAVESRTSVMAKRRCKKLIIGIIIGAVIATAITVGAFMAHRHYRHHHHHHDNHWKGYAKNGRGHWAEEHYHKDQAKRIIHLTRNATDHFFQMEAVLDFGTRLAGFKHSGKYLCYVDRLRENYERGCERFGKYDKKHARQPETRPLRVGPQINNDVLKYIAGEEIYKLCGNLPSFWVLEFNGPVPTGVNSTQVVYL